MWLTVELAAPSCALSSVFQVRDLPVSSSPVLIMALFELHCSERENPFPSCLQRSGQLFPLGPVSIPSQPAAPESLGGMVSAGPGCQTPAAAQTPF